jgi:anti-anti-sigma factor
MIFVTVGTEQYQFNALLDWIGVLLDYGYIDEKVVVQYGSSTSLPKGVKGFPFLPEQDFRALIDRSRLVVAHCGEGTALLLEDLAKPYILVPRMRKYGEHVDDHQVELADALEKQGVIVARSPADLVKFLTAINLVDFLAERGLNDSVKRLAGVIFTPKELRKSSLAAKTAIFLQTTDLSKFTSPSLFLDDVPEIRDLIAKEQTEPDFIAKYLCDRYGSAGELMLICSSGGHYKFMQELSAFWSSHPHTTWVTFRTPTTMADLQDCKVYWAYSPTNRNLPNLIRNFWLAFQVLRVEKPEVVVSTGAGVAVPFLIAAKYLCHSRTVFIEAKTRVKELSLSARLLALFRGVDRIIVQSEQLALKYPELKSKIKYVGTPQADTIDDDIEKPVSACTILSFKETAFVCTPEHLTILEAAKFRKDLEEICYVQYRKIVIDMSATQFIDSSGVGALVSVLRFAQESGNELVLWSIQPQVMAVLEMTKLKRAFKIENPTLSTRTANDDVEDSISFHPSVQSRLKRAIDIVGALVGLAFTAILFIPIAIAIKLDSPGPILFSQIRCGLLGKRFRIWKFRSMVSDAEALKNTVANQADGNFFKNETDPRITSVGRFLRKTSLDEFPQFWNVLVGDMSLVGTRPPLTDEVDNYRFDLYQLDRDTLINEWSRLDVKPGITGEWQVNGRSSVRKFEDVVKLDLQYQKNWSIKYDLWLILRTVLVLFDKKNRAV